MATGTKPTRSEDRYDRFAEAVDTPMLVITILWLPVLIIPLMTPIHGAMAETFALIDYTVWALFALEYIVKISLAPDRKLFFKKHVLDLVIIVVPFFRPLRLLRLLRVGVVFAEVVRRANPFSLTTDFTSSF